LNPPNTVSVRFDSVVANAVKGTLTVVAHSLADPLSEQEKVAGVVPITVSTNSTCMDVGARRYVLHIVSSRS